MNSGEPVRILVGPFVIYLAPSGTDWPAIDEPESEFDSDWVKLGENGHRNYDDDGVTLTLEDTKDVFRGAGETAIQKVWRTEEDAHVGLNLADMSPDQFALILNDLPVETVAAGASNAGEKKFPFYRGMTVATHQLLARGIGASTETLGLNMQYQFEKVYNEADPAPVHGKGGVALLACEFRAMVAGYDPDTDEPIYADAHVMTDEATS